LADQHLVVHADDRTVLLQSLKHATALIVKIDDAPAKQKTVDGDRQGEDPLKSSGGVVGGDRRERSSVYRQ
jgi:hypothetical protein